MAETLKNNRRAVADEEIGWAAYQTDRGWGAAVAGAGGVIEVFTPFGCSSRQEAAALVAGRYPAAVAGGQFAVTAADLLAAYFRGEPVTFGLPCDLRKCTPFQQAVYREVARITYGQVRSYQDIARSVGRPAAARGVGRAMSSNLLPIIIPCHRVVAASGALTGYSAPGGLDSKAFLLALEGAPGSGHAPQR